MTRSGVQFSLAPLRDRDRTPDFDSPELHSGRGDGTPQLVVALEDPVGGIPDLDVFDEPDYRFIRQFDEVWAAASPRLVDNSFDDAHVAYVHQGTIGSPDNARIPLPEIEMTDEGMVMNSVLEVENQLAVAQRTNLMEEDRIVDGTWPGLALRQPALSAE